ncbi:MAG: zinc-binding dehydrogenase [Chloroflexi bacterium]|nr:MAG: zinc-binding dehydrogenase [Chloroflexota bacterium]
MGVSQMQAAVLNGPGQVDVQAVPIPECGPDDVLLRIEAVGLCGSDFAIHAGHWRFPRPFVIGHEGYGRIVAIGSAVRDRTIGSLVVVEPNIVCGTCPVCRKGASSLCQHKHSLGVGTDGLCAQFARVPGAFVWPLPETIQLEDAVCIEPLAVALAAIRESGARSGDEVTVFGAGSQGLLLTLGLAALGIAPHVVDPQPQRLQLARDLGARAASVEAPEGSSSDVVFETSGAPDALMAAIATTAPGATVMLIGFSHQPVLVDTVRIVRQRLRVQGSIIYQHPVDFASTVGLVTDGSLHPGRVIKRTFALTDADQALRAAPTLPGKTLIAVTAHGRTG